MVGMRQIVDPPSFTPIPYGLLTAVEWPQISGPHWQNGITYVPTCGTNCDDLGASMYDDCISVTGSGGAPPPFTVDRTDPDAATVEKVIRGATPFTVGVGFQCSTVGNDQAQADAERALAAAEGFQVEYSFWTGLVFDQVAAFPHLAATDEVFDPDGILLQSEAIDVGAGREDCSPFITGDGDDITTGLGLLEQALASCYGGVGVIHIPELLLPTLDALGLVKVQGPTLKTLNGNKVAVGAGYTGSAPTGSPRTGGMCWMYATGNVFGYRSEVRVRDPQSSASSLDRSTNTRIMIAERTYVLGWDCCHFATQVDLGTCCADNGPV